MSCNNAIHFNLPQIHFLGVVVQKELIFYSFLLVGIRCFFFVLPFIALIKLKRVCASFVFCDLGQPKYHFIACCHE